MKSGIAPTLEGEPRRFTGSDSNDSHPRWSPDGSRIAFLSDRQKPKSRIYTIPTDGGEPTALTKAGERGRHRGRFRWSPNGTKIAFLFYETPEGYRKEQVEERQKKELPSLPRVHTTLNYRHDGGGFCRWRFWSDLGGGRDDRRLQPAGPPAPTTAASPVCSRRTAPRWPSSSDRRDDRDITLAL